MLVVLGTFLQFYMRAGIFTDGGKKERERAAAKAGRSSSQAEPPAEPCESKTFESGSNQTMFESRNRCRG